MIRGNISCHVPESNNKLYLELKQKKKDHMINVHDLHNLWKKKQLAITLTSDKLPMHTGLATKTKREALTKIFFGEYISDEIWTEYAKQFIARLSIVLSAQLAVKKMIDDSHSLLSSKNRLRNQEELEKYIGDMKTFHTDDGNIDFFDNHTQSSQPLSPIKPYESTQ